MSVLTAFGIGIVCAIMSSAPVGPINFAIMQATWGRGKKAAMQIGMGGAIADVAYAVVAWFIADMIVDNEDPAVFKWLNFLTIPVGRELTLTQGDEIHVSVTTEVRGGLNLIDTGPGSIAVSTELITSGNIVVERTADADPAVFEGH